MAERRRSGVAGTRLVRSGLVLAIATTGANVLSYALVVLLSRSLTAPDYGAVAALLNLVVVGTMPALAVQLTAARTTTAALAAGGSGEAEARHALRLGLGAGVALAALTVAAAPLLDALLHLGGMAPAVLLGVALIPSTLVAGVQGAMQGAERFGRLAALLLIAGVSRCLGGGVAAAAGLGVVGVMGGLLAGATLTLVVALVLAPAGALGRWPAASRPQVPSAGWRALLASTGSTAGLLVLVNLDVLLARHVLSGEASGTYAAGTLFSKIAFWGPAFLATLLYPRMTSPATRGRVLVVALALTAALGGAVVIVTAAAPEVVVPLLAGPRYAALGRGAALFAAVGAAFAVGQLLVYARLAVGDRRLGLAAWPVAGLLAAAVLGLRPRTVTPVAAAALGAALLLVALGLLAERRSRGRPADDGPDLADAQVTVVSAGRSAGTT